jgi:hypothetical protein
VNDYDEREYEVTWTIEVGAAGPIDAAEQAWAIMGDAISGFGVATILVVRCDEEPRQVIDMEGNVARRIAS